MVRIQCFAQEVSASGSAGCEENSAHWAAESAGTDTLGCFQGTQLLSWMSYNRQSAMIPVSICAHLSRCGLRVLVTLDHPPVQGIVANNSGRATGAAMNDEDPFSIDAALIFQPCPCSAWAGWNWRLILYVSRLFRPCAEIDIWCGELVDTPNTHPAKAFLKYVQGLCGKLPVPFDADLSTVLCVRTSHVSA